jgi:hypothetical protein
MGATNDCDLLGFCGDVFGAQSYNNLPEVLEHIPDSAECS